MILGITGGIASGKSTVSAYLRSKNIPIVDADAISHKVMGKGKPVLKIIEEEFGPQFFVDGRLDRQLLGQYCFRDEARVEKLNSIVHPFIFEEMEKQLQEHKDAPIVVLDAPLLIEAELYKRCDKVMVVTCSRGKRITRAIKRSNLPKLEIRKRMKQQIPENERLKYADYVIKNNSTIEKTFLQVDKVLKELNYE